MSDHDQISFEQDDYFEHEENNEEDNEQSDEENQDDDHEADQEKMIKQEKKERDEKKQNIPQFDPFKNPPKLIVVQGPPKSGKTTLIKSMIKHYTNMNVDPVGPVTIRVSQKQRVTIMECPNDISTMTDLGKIPDIVLTMIDASIGFEMQTFEFLSVLQIHGFPKCLGVVTHLDYYNGQKRVKKIKRQLRKRFAVEVSEETKLFFLSGMKNSLYNFRDVHNLTRLISVIIPRELEFKQKHPHLIIDRSEILTQKNLIQEKDRIDVSFFGYLRGGDLQTSKGLFINGLGFVTVQEIKETTDPCPLVQYSEDQKQKRTLKKREKAIYAPMSNIGVQLFDETGDYINIPDKHVIFTKIENQDEDLENDEGVQVMRQLQENQFQIDLQIKNQKAFLLDGMEIENGEEQKKFLEDLDEQLKQVAHLAQKVHEENEFFDKNKEKGIDFKTMIYEDFDFNTFSSKQQNNNDYFDCLKFVNENHQSWEEYKNNAKQFFVTGDFEESTEEEGNEEYEEEIIENENVDQVIEQLKNIIVKGKYVKVTIKNINFGLYNQMRRIPIIISQIDYGENTRGFLLVKFKRQKWYTALLKSNDPIIVSAGFHKYQTIPYYCKQDQGERLRFIKYTPKYDFCYAVFYGNYVPNYTGVIAFQSIQEDVKKFRVSGTGLVMGFSQDYKVKKKLKLVGEPMKIFKKTALVKGMFNSDMEVMKFMGAKIKTVSGIRGQIKKPVKEGAEGTFRATFEDKIIMSDLVVCRTWINVTLDKFLNPILVYDQQKLLKTTWQLRKKHGIEIEKGEDYKDVERPNKKFTPLMLPKSLKQELPFKTKEKVKDRNEKKLIEKAENSVVKTLVSKQEKEALYLINRLKEIQKEKQKNQIEKAQEKKRWKEKWDAGMKKKFEYSKKKKIEKMNKQKYSKGGKKKQFIILLRQLFNSDQKQYNDKYSLANETCSRHSGIFWSLLFTNAIPFYFQ